MNALERYVSSTLYYMHTCEHTQTIHVVARAAGHQTDPGDLCELVIHAAGSFARRSRQNIRRRDDSAYYVWIFYARRARTRNVSLPRQRRRGLANIHTHISHIQRVYELSPLLCVWDVRSFRVRFTSTTLRAGPARVQHAT